MNTDQETFVRDLQAAIARLEDGEQLSGDVLASLVSAIAALEIEEGGPYSMESEGDADVGLNLLIAYFLLLCEVDLPKLDAFLEEHLDEIESSVLSEDELCEIAAKWREKKQQTTDEPDGEKEIDYEPDERRVIDRTMRTCETRFAEFPAELRERAAMVIGRTILGNADKQMSLMAHFTKTALGKKGANIPDDAIAGMGLANIFFWTAFIIYDDFWDEDEAADPQLLPIANIFARHYTDYFSNLLPRESGFRAFFHDLMDKLDAANAWETEFCRTEIRGSTFIIPDTLPEYGDYELKFRPASGHILGPVAMLVRLGYGLDSPEITHFISYFRHYLIAMQINDDSHDWEEDLRRGHLSTVLVMLLQDLKEAYPEKIEIDLDADRQMLQEIFWFKTLARASRAILEHTEQSRRALHAVGIFEDLAPLEKYIDSNERAAKQALDEQKRSIDFLSTYAR